MFCPRYNNLSLESASLIIHSNHFNPRSPSEEWWYFNPLILSRGTNIPYSFWDSLCYLNNGPNSMEWKTSGHCTTSPHASGPKLTVSFLSSLFASICFWEILLHLHSRTGPLFLLTLFFSISHMPDTLFIFFSIGPLPDLYQGGEEWEKSCTYYMWAQVGL